MPSKDIICEFCNDSKIHRKNELARHVKAKHLKELGVYLLEEYINQSSGTLKRYMNASNPKYNPVYSKIYDGAVYYFGANAMFFEQEDDYNGHLNSDENMKIHDEFIEEIINTISLMDYIKLNREAVIKSPIHNSLAINYNRNLKRIKELEEENNSLTIKKNNLNDIINTYKNENDCQYTIDELKQSIKDVNRENTYNKKELDYYQGAFNTLKERQQKDMDDTVDELLGKKRTVENQLEDYVDKNHKLKIELETAIGKRETYANTKVEKELIKQKESSEKELTKLKELMDKTVQKMKKKNETIVEELEEEVEKLKRQLKKAKRDSEE